MARYLIGVSKQSYSTRILDIDDLNGNALCKGTDAVGVAVPAKTKGEVFSVKYVWGGVLVSDSNTDLTQTIPQN